MSIKAWESVRPAVETADAHGWVAAAAVVGFVVAAAVAMGNFGWWWERTMMGLADSFVWGESSSAFSHASCASPRRPGVLSVTSRESSMIQFAGRVDDQDVALVQCFDARAVGGGPFFVGEGFPEAVAAVVVTHGQVNGDAGVAQGAEEVDQRFVVGGFAGVVGAVAVDEDGAGKRGIVGGF